MSGENSSCCSRPSRPRRVVRAGLLAAMLAAMVVPGGLSGISYPPAVSVAPTVSYEVEAGTLSPLSRLSVADVNRDRRPDVLVANPASGEISVLLARSAGRLAPPRRVPATAGVSSVAAGDLDRDGKVDLVVGPEIAVLRGDGSGGFGAPVRAIGAPLYSVQPHGAVALADLNRDSFLDVVVLSPTAGVMSILGDGTGALTLRYCCTPVHRVGGKWIVFAIGGLNSDTYPDVAVLEENPAEGYVTLMFGDGVGNFGSTARRSVSPRGKVSQAVIGDFYGDSHLDLAVMDDGLERIYGYEGDGLGGFTFKAGSDASDTWRFEVADLNGDRRADIVQVRSYNFAVALANARGDVGFPVPFGAARGDRTDGVTTGDLDLDGRQDVLRLNARASTVSVVRSLRPVVRATCRRPSRVSTRFLRCDVWRSQAARRASVTLRLDGPMGVPGTRRLTARIPRGHSATTLRASRPIPSGNYLITAIATLPTGNRAVGQTIVLQ